MILDALYFAKILKKYDNAVNFRHYPVVYINKNYLCYEYEVRNHSSPCDLFR